MIKISSVIVFSCLICGCNPQPNVVGGPARENVKLGDVTLQGLIKFPDGRVFIQAEGHAAAPETEKEKDVRQRMSRDLAVIDAQKKLIVQLSKIVPRNKIHDVLRKAELGTIQFTYDDACNLTLKIPKEAIEGKESIR